MQDALVGDGLTPPQASEATIEQQLDEEAAKRVSHSARPLLSTRRDRVGGRQTGAEAE